VIALEERDGDVIIPVRASAGASGDRLMGEHAGMLKVSVSAPPEKGKANKAVCALIARTLGVAKSRVAVIAGETSRDKKVLVRGADKDTIARQITQPLRA
jgi:uncharacterized protein (TIGR00251 family)